MFCIVIKFKIFFLQKVFFYKLKNWNIDAELADADALLLIENVKPLNYVNGNRFVGFDTNETVAVTKVWYLVKYKMWSK